MKKLLIFVCFLMICLPNANIVHAESKTEWICIANYCYIYSSPSFTAEKVLDENFEEIVVLHKDILTLEENENGVVEYNGFYKVLSVGEIAISEGYIFSDFVTENLSQIETYPTFNATLKNDTYLFEVSGEEFTQTETLLEKGTRIYLYEGYDNDINGYVAVAVKIGSGLQYGYVLKTEVSPDGINPAIIYAITIALACIGIITALLFMKNKKKKI